MSMVNKLVKIPVYTLNFRMYPNKKQKEIIDCNLVGLKKAYNNTVYQMFTNFMNTSEKSDKEEDKTVHFPNISMMTKKEHLQWLKDTIPELENVPASAMSGKMGIFKSNLAKSLATQVGEKNSNRSINGKGAMKPVEKSQPHYYSKNHPLSSYTYQKSVTKFNFTDNPNVIKFNIAKIGIVKLRGCKGYFDQLRFGNEGQYTFKEAMENNIFVTASGGNKNFFVTIKKDNCDDYFLQVCFSEIDMFRFIKINEKRTEVGIDVGIGSLMTLSNGTKYKNPMFATNKNIVRHREELHRKLSRSYGPSNIKFREDMKIARKDGRVICPSKHYYRVKIKVAKFERKLQRKRKNYMENIVLDVVRNYNYIAIESLSVTEMFNRKENKNSENK